MRRACSITSTRGFTLVEIMVVILIIGLGIGIVSFNIGGNKPLALRSAASELAHQIEITASEATLGNEAWGLQFYRATDAASGEGYVAWRWLHFRTPETAKPVDADGNRDEKRDGLREDRRDEKSAKKNPLGWQPEAPRDLDAGGRFDSNVDAVLEIEGREVAIELLASDDKRDAKKSSSKEDDKNALQPDVWLAPGGEMTPFALHVNFVGERNGPIVRGDALGRVEVEVNDDARE